MNDHRLLPSAREVRAAASRLTGLVRRTPTKHSSGLSALCGGDVFLKLECWQESGSFKLRGAIHALLSLSDDQRAAGVVTSSAGNHGLGVAVAAARLGIRATIFIPATAPSVKRRGIVAAGATVHATEPDYDSAEVAARANARATGATFLSPCTGRPLLAGAGTVALEVLEDLPTLRTIIVPVGGGGLVGGIGGFLREAAPGTRILGAQSIRTNAMALALAADRAIDIPYLPTLADGLAGRVDEEMFNQGKAALTAIATVTEESIQKAMQWLTDEEQLVAEGSAAVGVAALLSGSLTPPPFPAVVVITGANVDRE